MGSANQGTNNALTKYNIQSGITDPSIVAQEGDRGTIYIQANDFPTSGAIAVWQKQDFGLTTNWTLFGGGGGGGEEVNAGYAGATGTITPTPTNVIYPTKEFDTNNAYNTGTGVYTVPDIGAYQINANISCNAFASQVTLAIDINGTRLQDTTLSIDDDTQTIVVAGIASCTAGDLITIVAFVAADQTATILADSNFSLALISATAQGTAIPQTEFVFQPGGTAGDGVYTSWAALYADLSLVKVPTTVYIDSSIIDPAVIPHGTYDMSLTAIVGMPKTETSFIEFADGAIFEHPFSFAQIGIRSTSASPVITYSGGLDVLFLSGLGTASITSPLISIVAGEQLTVYIDNTLIGHNFFTIDDASFLEIVASIGSIAANSDDSISGPVGAQLLISLDASSTFTPQVGFFGTVVNNLIDKADHVGYVPDVSGNWPTPNPTQVAQALDDLAAAAPIGGAANQTLSNLTAPVMLNHDLLPGTQNSTSLGNMTTGFFEAIVNRGVISAFTTTQVGTISSGSNSMTVASAADLFVDMAVYGPGLPLGTAINNISGTTLTLNNNATANEISVTFTFVSSIVAKSMEQTGTNPSGDALVRSGNTVDGTSGSTFLQSGNTTGTGASGLIFISSGNTPSAASGETHIRTGNVAGAALSGETIIQTGTSVGGGTGEILIQTGNDTAAGVTGAVVLETGASTGASSGEILIQTGASPSAATGPIFVESGDGTGSGTGTVRIASGDDSAAGATGAVQLLTGNSAGGGTGDLNLFTGSDSAGGVIGNINIGAGNSTAGDVVGGDISITAGNGSGAGGGSITIACGNDSGAGGGGEVRISAGADASTSASIFLNTLNAGTDSGDINLTTGTATTRGTISLDSLEVMVISPLDMGMNQIHNLHDPGAPQDAATQAYVLAHAGTGTVDTVAIATANGFQGTSSGGANPVLTIEVDLTNGAIPFVSGLGTELVDDPTHLFWDATNFRLGLGDETPAYPVVVNTFLPPFTTPPGFNPLMSLSGAYAGDNTQGFSIDFPVNNNTTLSPIARIVSSMLPGGVETFFSIRTTPNYTTTAAVDALTIDGAANVGIAGNLTVAGVIDPTQLLLTGADKKLGATDAGPIYIAPFADQAGAVQIRKADDATNIVSIDSDIPQVNLLAPMDMGMSRIHNLADPGSAQDAATQAYVLAHSGSGPLQVEFITVTSLQASSKQIILAATPANPGMVLVAWKGVTQFFPTDYSITTNTLGWSGLGLDTPGVAAGDQMVISYNT